MARPAKPERPRSSLTKGQWRLLVWTQALGLIRTEHNGQGRHCFFDNGRLVNGRQLDALLKKGFLAPVGDALLPDDTQSYRLTDKPLPPEETGS